MQAIKNKIAENTFRSSNDGLLVRRCNNSEYISSSDASSCPPESCFEIVSRVNSESGAIEPHDADIRQHDKEKLFAGRYSNGVSNFVIDNETPYNDPQQKRTEIPNQVLDDERSLQHARVSRSFYPIDNYGLLIGRCNNVEPISRPEFISGSKNENEISKRVGDDNRSSPNTYRSCNRLFWYWKERRWFRIDRFWSWTERQWKKKAVSNRPGAEGEDLIQHDIVELLVRRYNNGGNNCDPQVTYCHLESCPELISGVISGSKDGDEMLKQGQHGNSGLQIHTLTSHNNRSSKLIQVKPGTFHLRHFEPKGPFEAKVALLNRSNNADPLSSSPHQLSSSTRFGILFLLIVLTGFSSCKKFVDIPPPQSKLVVASTFSSDAGAIAAQSSIYANFATGTIFFCLTYYESLSADELDYYGSDPNAIQLYTNSLDANNQNTYNIWSTLYNLIYEANSVLSGLQTSNGVSAKVKSQLIGEAKFIRGFCYFYLTNLFGDVPLATSPTFQINSVLPRANKNDVYRSIINDLKDAKVNLNTDFLSADCITTTNDRLRPTKWAAGALLARTYLYTQNWDSAAYECDTVIKNSTQFGLEKNLNDVFLINSHEAIWQVQQIANTSVDTYEGNYLILPSAPPSYNTTAISNHLLNIFETGDLRRTNWVDSVIDGDTYYYPYKYKVLTSSGSPMEDEMVFRLGELYLIRAEAKANLGDISAAQADLNAIRIRANLQATTANTSASLLTAIMHEREAELFTEIGQRWLDLKRLNSVDSVMKVATPVKGKLPTSIWNTTQQLYPIPAIDLQSDPNLTPNPGY